MKSFLLLFCVAVFALVSCSDSTSTNSTDARTAIVGTWNVKYTSGGSADQTMTFSVSGDSVITYGVGTKATFNGNNVKFANESSGITQSYDISFSDNNNFAGSFTTSASGFPATTIAVTGVRK